LALEAVRICGTSLLRMLSGGRRRARRDVRFARPLEAFDTTVRKKFPD
jgi:hypothetical protein